MKKTLRILITALLSLTLVVGLFACDGTRKKGSEKGLLFKMYSGDDFYTVYGYVDDGTGITSLDIGKYNTETVKIGRIKANAFKDNDTIKELIIPNTVETMDSGAFANMKALENLTVPFVGKTAVADVYYNSSESSENKAVGVERTFGYLFGTEEYEGGVAITGIYDNGTEEKTDVRYIPTSLNKVVVSAKAVSSSEEEGYSIPMFAFAGNNLISEVVLNNVVNIGSYAFYNCDGLEKLTVPKTCVKIYEYAFSGCANLKDGLKFEENSACTELGKYAFKECKNLIKITLPSSITEIPYGAFYNCEKMTEITAEGIIKVKSYAFYGSLVSECNGINGNSPATDAESDAFSEIPV